MKNIKNKNFLYCSFWWDHEGQDPDEDSTFCGALRIDGAPITKEEEEKCKTRIFSSYFISFSANEIPDKKEDDEDYKYIVDVLSSKEENNFLEKLFCFPEYAILG